MKIGWNAHDSISNIPSRKSARKNDVTKQQTSNKSTVILSVGRAWPPRIHTYKHFASSVQMFDDYRLLEFNLWSSLRDCILLINIVCKSKNDIKEFQGLLSKCQHLQIYPFSMVLLSSVPSVADSCHTNRCFENRSQHPKKKPPVVINHRNQSALLAIATSLNPAASWN